MRKTTTGRRYLIAHSAINHRYRRLGTPSPPICLNHHCLLTCPYPTSTPYTRAAPCCSRQSVKPPVERPASRATRPETATGKYCRARSNLSPALGEEGRETGMSHMTEMGARRLHTDYSGRKHSDDMNPRSHKSIQLPKTCEIVDTVAASQLLSMR